MAEHDKMAIIDDAKTIENEVPLTEEQRRRLEEFIEEEEGALNRYKGVLAVIMTAAAVLMSLFHLYAAVEIVPAYILRPVHVAFALALVFLLFRKHSLGIRARVLHVDLGFLERDVDASLRKMSDAPVVRDSKHEGSLRAFAAEGRQRAPKRHRDLLEQIVAITCGARVARGEATQCGTMLVQQPA